MLSRRTALLAVLLTGRILAAQTAKITVTVLDENAVAVPAARVTLQSPDAPLLRCETGFSGRCLFFNLPAGAATIRAEKEGFYAITLPSVQIGATADLEITLSHLQEVKEVVDVVESPPAIDPAKTQAQEQLTGMDIVNIPYPSTNDYR